MVGRLGMVWVRVRDSLWFLPGLLTALAALLAFAATQVEIRGVFSLPDQWWVFGGGVDGAREVLGVIAGGLITVTGVVFSVTIVALQLASSQFTPRVLRNFMADRGNQAVLGVFIGTFTYTLLVLRTIRSQSSDGESFVPRLAVTLALVLMLVSIGFLIFFVNHVATSIQISSILDRVTQRVLGDVERVFPESLGRDDDRSVPDPREEARAHALVLADRAGYLQAVDGARLFELGKRRRIVVAMEPHIGAFLLPGQVLARVWPPEAADEEAVEEIREAFSLGAARTPTQDVEFGLIELSDIAVKALSPGINDPTTALHCIDRLAEVLLALGCRNPPQPERTEEGRVHFFARHTTFERAVAIAFDQIRLFGASNPDVVRRMLQRFAGLLELLPPPHRAPVLEQARATLRAARRAIESPEDRAVVEAAARPWLEPAGTAGDPSAAVLLEQGT